jgi:hypothetical protein
VKNEVKIQKLLLIGFLEFLEFLENNFSRNSRKIFILNFSRNFREGRSLVTPDGIQGAFRFET